MKHIYNVSNQPKSLCGFHFLGYHGINVGAGSFIHSNCSLCGRVMSYGLCLVLQPSSEHVKICCVLYYCGLTLGYCQQAVHCCVLKTRKSYKKAKKKWHEAMSSTLFLDMSFDRQYLYHLQIKGFKIIWSCLLTGYLFQKEANLSVTYNLGGKDGLQPKPNFQSKWLVDFYTPFSDVVP
jgi:hypothetical protein